MDIFKVGDGDMDMNVDKDVTEVEAVEEVVEEATVYQNELTLLSELPRYQKHVPLLSRVNPLK